jgi:hypothetical protein
MKLNLLALAIALGACGGTTAPSASPPQEDGATGDASPTAAVFPSIRNACTLSPDGFVQSPPPPQGPSLQACLGSDQVMVPDAQIDLPDGGVIVAGSTATLTAVIANSGTEAVGYPCVGVVASRDGVSIGAGGPELFGVTPGGTVTLTVPLTFDASIVPGRIFVGLWAVWQGTPLADASTGPCTSTSSTVVDMTVQ